MTSIRNLVTSAILLPGSPTHTKASFTAAKAPSKTSAIVRSGSQRSINPTHIIRMSIELLCFRFLSFSSARHNRLRNGNAQTLLDQGSFTITISESHFKPKHLTTCFLLERRHPTPLIFLPRRRSMVSSAPMTMAVEVGRSSPVRPSRIRAASKVENRSRFNTR